MAIRAMGIKKKYKEKTIIDDVDISVSHGSIFGLIGPNGAGKSTLMKILSGLLMPDAGTIHILGKEMTVDNVGLKRLIGVMTEEPALYDLLTGEEYLAFSAMMFGLDKDMRNRRIEEMVELFSLGDYKKEQINTYSTGMKKRLAIAAVFLHDPQLLFLDEPFTGIDPHFVRLIKDYLKDITQCGKTVFLTSHILPIVEELCDEISICHEGKILFSGNAEQVRSRARELRETSNDSTLENLFLHLTEQEGHHGL